MIRENIERNLDFIIGFILFILSLLLRLPHYTKQPIFADEIGYFSAYSFSILSHGWAWPVKWMTIQPPLFPYILALVTYLSNGSLEVLRIVPIISGSLTTFALYFLGKILFDRRVGILSAILLCFCSYHIFYSRVLQLEAQLIFFLIVSSYFFFRSYKKDDDIKYACLSGIFLGLACITKYVGYLLCPVFAIFILWTKKKLKCLVRRKILIIFLTSILTISPVWLDLYIHNVNPILHQLRIMKAPSGAAVGIKSIDFFDLVIRGFNNFINLCIDGHSIATSSLPWHTIFQLAASFLLIITILYYISPVLKRRQSESFIFIFFVVFNIFCMIYRKRFEYYLLWALPMFFIMLSNMSIRFFDQIKLQYIKKRFEFPLLNFMRILTLIFVIIFIFSYVVTGTMAPFVNKGVRAGYEESVIKIRNAIQDGDSIATSLPITIDYYLNKYGFNSEEHDIQIFDLYKKDKKGLTFTKGVDIEMLEEVKPRFIITSERYQSAYSDIRDNIIIRNNYDLILEEDEILLFERKVLMQPDNENLDNETEMSSPVCIIYSDVFSRSIPRHMTIGKSYDAFIYVKNTGEQRRTFVIKLFTPGEFIYPQLSGEIIQLESGESYKTKFPIMPVKQHVGELNVTARLYLVKSRQNLPSSFVELDNVSTPVLWIKKTFPLEEIMRLTGVIILIVSGVLLIMNKFTCRKRC